MKLKSLWASINGVEEKHNLVHSRRIASLEENNDVTGPTVIKNADS